MSGWSLTPDHHVQIEVEQEETLAPPTLEDAVAQHDLSALSEATATRDESTFLSVSGNIHLFIMFILEHILLYMLFF